MRTSRLGEAVRLICSSAALFICAASTFASPIEPTPFDAASGYRAPRSDYVKSWYVYKDTNNNGILDPGDRMVAPFKNWWTPVSGGTQGNLSQGPYGGSFNYTSSDDITSGPMNFATATLPEGDPRKTQSSTNYWLPRAPNAVNFYMTYSQRDNNDWTTFDPGGTATNKALQQKWNMNRNGWALGWTINDVKKDAQGNYINDQTAAGNVNMDIYVHNGQGTLNVPGFGTSRSNPQVTMSNDISSLALFHPDGVGGSVTPTQRIPMEFDSVAKNYNVATNQVRLTNDGLSTADFNTIVASQELKEVDPLNLSPAIWGAKTPQALMNANVKDSSGNPYQYQDAFQAGFTYVNGATDGGVIAGLAGQSSYSSAANNWGDQQVIRVDFSPADFMAGNAGADGGITQVVFWDFGAPGSGQQINPVPIVLDLANFNENRFFIAQVDFGLAPEPCTLIVLGLGGLFLTRRRQRA